MGRRGFGFGTARRRRAGSAATPAPMTAIAADGWQATVTAPVDLSLLPATVSRQGFDNTGATTTISETVYLTKRVRQAWPNDASLTANTQALSDYVYATDTIAGVTNNSAQASPKPVAQWIMPSRLVVGNTVDLECTAFHRNARGGAQVACVIFRATDGTNTVTQTVAATAVSGRTGDQCAVVSYKASLDISSLNAGLITCHAKVYPWIGGAASVLDSADSSVAREFSARYFLKNTTLAASPPYAYVATTGNDGTGVVSTTAATAAASPFLTVLGAINAIHTALGGTTGIDGAIIRIGNDGGTPFVLGSTAATRTQKVAALTITRDPNVARANARVSFGASSFRARFGTSGGTLTAPLTTGAIRFADVGLVRTGTSTLLGESTTHLEVYFDDVDFDNASNDTTWLSSSHDYVTGMTLTNALGGVLGAGATPEHRLMRGLNWHPSTTGAGRSIEAWCVVGCDLYNPLMTRGTRTRSGGIVAFNKVRDPGSTTPMLVVASDEDVTGFAFVQNQIEYISATTNHDLGLSNDSATGSNTHIVIHNNTHAGAFQAGRQNWFYDEGSTPRTSKLHSVKGNILVQINTKSDVYRGANQANPEGFTVGSPSTRTGSWAFLFGVGCAYNWSQYIDANSGGLGTSFAQAWGGIGSTIGTSATVRNDPLFTSYAGTTVAAGPAYTAGAGGGTYTLTAPSPCKAALPEPLLSHNLAGTARPASNDNIGAW